GLAAESHSTAPSLRPSIAGNASRRRFSEGCPMPKYLIKASYTAEGIKGVLKEGGTSRRSAVEQLAKGLGGGVDAFYFAFGDDDVYTILEFPDNVSAAAVSMTVCAGGAVRSPGTVLL